MTARHSDEVADTPSQFYTGLVADLYEPLVSEHARADDYVPFLDRSGTPALELCCGSGLPLLDLVARGYDVEGLDASQDMLDHCQAGASERGLRVTLHRAEMQAFSLAKRYRAIFIAGASLTLLTSDVDAQRCLDCIYAHLQPGGSTLITLEIVDTAAQPRALGRSREITTADGTRLRVGMTAFQAGEDGRSLSRRLRYERIAPNGVSEVLERDWQTRWWPQAMFGDMLRTAGFSKVTFLAPQGGPASADADVFTVLARRDP